MLNRKEIFELLFEKNFLWNSETQKEGRILLKSYIEKFPNESEKIVKRVLEGPSKKFKQEIEEYEKWSDLIRQETLSFLDSKDLPIFKEGSKFINKIKGKYPDLFPKKKERPQVITQKKSFEDMSAGEVYKFLIELEDESYRDLRGNVAFIGHRCSENYEFCNKLFNLVSENIGKFPENLMSHIIWGIRPEPDAKDITWTIENVKEFLNILESTVTKRPEPQIWYHLPSLIERWFSILKLDIKDFSTFLQLLSEIFADFDKEHDPNRGSVDWLTRAINHPYGHLTDTHINFLIRIVNEKIKKGEEIEIDIRFITFFSYTLKQYGKGSRYGLCIISRYLAWLEAILPDWTESNLTPIFKSACINEKELISWVGYLWSNRISPNLTRNFEKSYLFIATKYNELGPQEKRGLIFQVAAIFWSFKADISLLKKFTNLIDQKGRKSLIDAWGEHLERASKDIAEKFFESTIIPYWEWYMNQTFLNTPESNELKFSFWLLLPFSYNYFELLVQKALEMAPNEIERSYYLIQNISKSDYLLNYPDALSSLLNRLIIIDKNPILYKDELYNLWNKLKNTDSENIDKLGNELAQKGIIE